MADPFVAEIRIFPFNFAPTGWAFCNGQILPISQNTALFSGTLAEGVNYHLYPRCRGMAAYIKLSNSNSSKWAFERMIITSVIGGVQRI